MGKANGLGYIASSITMKCVKRLNENTELFEEIQKLIADDTPESRSKALALLQPASKNNRLTWQALTLMVANRLAYAEDTIAEWTD